MLGLKKGGNRMLKTSEDAFTITGVHVSLSAIKNGFDICRDIEGLLNQRAARYDATPIAGNNTTIRVSILETLAFAREYARRFPNEDPPDIIVFTATKRFLRYKGKPQQKTNAET
jgi:hypothetical protein